MERFLPTSYSSVFVWSLAVLLGMIGWGRLVGRLVGGDAARHAGWGLEAAWGMGIYLFAGAVLATFGAFGKTNIQVLIAAGWLPLIWTTLRGPRPTRATLIALPWKMWPAFVVAALLYSGGLCAQMVQNPCDDLPAYHAFCEKLLVTGSFEEPFSWRRLASFGGHTLLQCSILARGSWAHAQAFEMALCPVILLGVVLGFREGALARSRLGLLLSLAAITTPIIRVNTASHFSGVILFLGLFATLDLAERAGAQRRGVLVVAGLVAAALCSLRAQYIPAAGGALGVFWLASCIRDRPAWRASFCDLGIWSGSLLVALAPWMIMAFLSNGSPLFPLFPGTNNAAFNPQTLNNSAYVQLTTPVLMILHPALLPLLLCLVCLPNWRRGVAARAAAVAAVGVACALAGCISLAPDAVTIPRYVQPLLVAGALAALMSAALAPRGRLLAWAMTALLIATSLRERSLNLFQYYAELANTGTLVMPFGAEEIADHRRAQALVPAGQRILVCSDYPFVFDHRRNPIWIIDLPHASSPAPGLPFHQPADALKRYFRGAGIDYVIFADFAHSTNLYNRSVWEAHATGAIELWKIQAPFFLDFFTTMEALAAAQKVLGSVGHLTVLQLQP